MKKFITLFLIVVLVFMAVGCGNTNTDTTEIETTNETSNATEEATNNEATEDATNNEATEDATNNEATENEATEDATNTEVTENEATENEATNTEATENETTENEATNTESTEEETTEEETTEEQPQIIENPIDITKLELDNRPLVSIEMEDGKIVKLALVPEIAPNTVNSFISLIEDGYYNGLIFHRIIKDFMIQGGDPTGTGMGGPGYTIVDEFYIFDEETSVVTFLPHYRGVISMAKTQAPNSAGSQFFIVHQDAHFLNGSYAAFGYVLEGMDIVDSLAVVETGEGDKPVEDVVIKTITVDLNGYEAKEPVVIQ